MNWRWAAALLILHLPAQSAQEKDSLRLVGEKAMASDLWEIAAMRYQELLSHPELTKDERPRAAMRLVEAWIRNGQPAEALELLAESFVASEPDAGFWRAHGLAGTHRLREAIEAFGELLKDPKAPYRAAAARTRANLQLLLGLHDEALATLRDFAATAPAADAVPAQLQRIGLLLDLDRPQEARQTLMALDALPEEALKRSVFLEARLLLAEGDPATAAESFEALLASPRHQSLPDHHAVALGLADAQAQSQGTETALATLIAFIGDHPDSPLLEFMFARLLRWLPETPAVGDATLETLRKWVPAPTMPKDTGAIAVDAPDATAAWPTRTTPDPLASYAMFTRAIGLRRIGTPAAQAEADSLMFRVRIYNPAHPLVVPSMLEVARWKLDSGEIDQAFAMLEWIEENTLVSDLQARAAFIKARAAYDRGEGADAAAAFEKAAELFQGNESEVAKLNSALARLGLAEGADDLALIQNPAAGGDPAMESDFELERALSVSSAVERRAALDGFLLRYPDHPRMPEARLAAAEASLEGPEPDPERARKEYEVLKALPENPLELPPPRLAFLRLRIADEARDTTETIEVAREILELYPDEPMAAEAAFTLGRTLFLTGDYNDARLVLAKLAAGETDTARAQAAWLLAARAAALGATAQSRDEALALFDSALAADGPLDSLVIQEKGRFMIDHNRLPAAAAFLREHYQALPEDDPLRLPVGLLLGEAIYAKGSSSPELLEEALEIYDSLLASPQTQPAERHRLQYRRGMTLELLPRKDRPELTRNAEALDAYISVLDAAANKPPAEWEYFELCAFRAFELLKAAQRWKAAIAVAERIASFNSPNASEAAEAAQSLRLKHMIWDD